ncbi:hypothetical protein CLV92_117102 [Kineococcus xinjiangensis]|uniref:Uncharacterized protein n=1 Tax=Kineococcus xinjiangensis TaxID=512762 RepID=A0A2S6ID35_9ACTN|nr:hypothetical protein [Kineococcus xinjiangensis]PPK92134.1 hypothetical protein CLV92_117102 [Kineococcus xinjiangensis]
MAARRRPPSFAEVVEAVKAAPADPPPFDLLGPGGRGFRLVTKGVSAEDAFVVAQGGAILGWDACGCNGDCGYRWFDEADVARMVAAGRPKILHKRNWDGAITHLRSDDGGSLLLVKSPVRWGEHLD